MPHAPTAARRRTSIGVVAAAVIGLGPLSVVPAAAGPEASDRVATGATDEAAATDKAERRARVVVETRTTLRRATLPSEIEVASGGRFAYVLTARSFQKVSLGRDRPRVVGTNVDITGKEVVLSPRGAVAYVLSGDGRRLQVVDLRRPTPRVTNVLIGTALAPEAVYDIAISPRGDRLYASYGYFLGSGPAGLQVLSLARPHAPRPIGRVASMQKPGTLAVAPDGRTVVSTNAFNGGFLLRYDVRDPARPRVSARRALAFDPSEVVYDRRGGAAYVSGYTRGGRELVTRVWVPALQVTGRLGPWSAGAWDLVQGARPSRLVGSSPRGGAKRSIVAMRSTPLRRAGSASGLTQATGLTTVLAGPRKGTFLTVERRGATRVLVTFTLRT